MKQLQTDVQVCLVRMSRFLQLQVSLAGAAGQFQHTLRGTVATDIEKLQRLMSSSVTLHALLLQLQSC